MASPYTTMNTTSTLSQVHYIYLESMYTCNHDYNIEHNEKYCTIRYQTIEQLYLLLFLTLYLVR